MEALRSSAVLATACAVAAISSAATAAPTLPRIEIASSPKVQTVEARVIAKAGAKTPTLVLGTARFTITVTNPSPITLSGVTVSDPRSPRCNLSIGTLAPGASIAFTCSRANVGRSYTNVATASGRRSTGARDFASARVTATATATSLVRVKPKTITVGVPSFTG